MSQENVEVVRRMFDDYSSGDDALETFAEIRVQPSEFRDADKRVLVLGELVAKGAMSEAPFAASMGWLFEVEGGMVVRGRDYLDQREALEAAGLSE